MQIRADEPGTVRSIPVWDVGDFAKALRRHWVIILVAVVALTVIAGAYTYTREPIYRSTAKVVVTPMQPQLTQQLDPNKISAQTETSLAKSVTVAERAKQLMSSPRTPQQLLSHVSASMTQGSQILSVSFSAPQPDAAQKGAAAFSNAYLQYRQDAAGALITNYQNQLQVVSKQIRTLSSRRRTLPAGSPQRTIVGTKLQSLAAAKTALQTQIISLQAATVGAGELIDPASLPTAPSSPNHRVDLALGFVVGLILGVGVALVRERTRHSLRSPEELEEHLGAPVLASIPRLRASEGKDVLVVGRGRVSAAANAYRRLRISFLSMAERSGWKTILIASADSPDATSMTVANLGAALSESGKRVVAVSADIQRAMLDQIFNTNGSPGLIQVLSEATSPLDAIRESSIPNLRLVPSGPTSKGAQPANLVQSPQMKELLLQCGLDADFVLLDSPPILRDPDALDLARLADGVIVVAKAGGTSWEDIDGSVEELRRAGAVIIGGVLDASEIRWRSRSVDGSRRPPSTDPAIRTQQDLVRW